MATRIYTAFVVPLDDPLEDNRGAYWVDVEESYEDVFGRIWPIHPAASSLEARASFQYHKIDGGQFACHPNQVCGIEELIN